jgi:hypothetical protein
MTSFRTRVPLAAGNGVGASPRRIDPSPFERTHLPQSCRKPNQLAESTARCDEARKAHRGSIYSQPRRGHRSRTRHSRCG